jgi:uncharacterized membrane protein
VSIIFAALSALTFGVSDFVGGFTSKRVPALAVVVWAHVVGLAALVVAIPFYAGSPSGPIFLWGALSGLSGVIGLIFLFRGLSEGRMAVVAPVSAVISAIVPVVYGLSLGERPGPLAATGMVVGVVAIWLASSSAPGTAGPSGLGFGVLAGLGFAGFFIFLAAAPDDAGSWLLVPARIASVTVVLAVAAIAHTPMRLPRDARLPVAFVGVAEVVANGLFVAAVSSGLVSLVAVVTSLYPAFTVLLAFFVAREHVRARQWVGLAGAVACLALVGI